MKTNPISGERIKPMLEIRIRRFFDFKFKIAIYKSKKNTKKYAKQFERFLINQINSDKLSDLHKEIAGLHILNSKAKTTREIKILDDLKWKHSRGL